MLFFNTFNSNVLRGHVPENDDIDKIFRTGSTGELHIYAENCSACTKVSKERLTIIEVLIKEMSPTIAVKSH